MTIYNYMLDGDVSVTYGDFYFWRGYEDYMNKLDTECIEHDLDRLKHPEKYVFDFDNDEELPF